MMLSGECSYTFGSVVKAVGRVRCLEKLWKLEVFCEVSLEWDRYLGYWYKHTRFWKVFPERGVENLVVLGVWIPLRMGLKFC